MNIQKEVIKSVRTFYESPSNDINGRYKSWEHCYKQFHDARNNNCPDYDFLSLHLAFYLASWGMYRGSSFLLQKDYKVHIPVVKEILKPEFDCLFGLQCSKIATSTNKNMYLDKIFDLVEFMKKYYSAVRQTVKGTEIKTTDFSILTSKILMGTLGCVPAYDTNFVFAIRKYKIAIGVFNRKSLIQLAQFYNDYHRDFESERKTLRAHSLLYPTMKFLDMAFWQIGLKEIS